MEPLKQPKKSPIHKIVAFDFETTQNDKVFNGFEHRVNFAACKVMCEKCMDKGLDSSQCDKCNSHVKYWSKLEGDNYFFN